METSRYRYIAGETIKMGCPAIIGRLYIYPDDDKKKMFKLKIIDRKEDDFYIFHFACGHCCTNSVFEDLIMLDKEDLKQLQLL